MSDEFERRYRSAMECVEKLDARVKELEQAIMLLEAQKRQWEIEKANQQAVIHQALTTSNHTSNQYLEENRRLQAEIERLKG